MKPKKTVIKYTEVNGWSINGKPAKKEEAWLILTENYQEKKAADQLTRYGAVKIEI